MTILTAATAAPQILPPKTLADAKIRLTYCTYLSDPENPTIAELNAGIDLSQRVLKADYRLSATASETVDDQAALSDESNPVVLGPSNYEGLISIFRWFDPTHLGRHDTLGDIAFQALKDKGTGGYMVARETGKRFDAAWEATDEVDVYEILTDTPQKPTDNGGFIRRTVPLNPQRAWQNRAVRPAVTSTGGR
ncbi:hypothetical protein NBM05_08435 [Rothia sp. AR01]|uniref:Uncharacterized protein n=1 Tax=Rothia santali TaxID=2949643 RepID=A0A9X2HKP0_9MICC|nr:hypothetical protein [Rothia santali]MCP3426028.1 hypothetical protein [Rothia santali]